MAKNNKEERTLPMEIPAEGDKNKAGWVNIHTERGSAEVYIGVNGTGYLIPPGTTTLVPPEVAAEFERAEKAKDAFLSEARSLQK